MVLLRQVLGDATWEQFPDQVKRMFTANGPAILAEFRGGGLEVDAAALACEATSRASFMRSDPGVRRHRDPGGPNVRSR